MNKGSILYLSHGGGPLPLLGDEAHQEMVSFLKQVTPSLGNPAAILVISAHWEENKPTLTRGASSSLFYDYQGFPAESYEIKYPAPGEPILSNKIFSLLKNCGIEADFNDQRGFDHGVFVPLKIMYPAATIPCVQLSLVRGLRPDQHIQIGKALAGLVEDNVLIIGSGFSFHNMRAFFSPSTSDSLAMNEAFEQWLIATCTNRQLSEADREQHLLNWDRAPAARYCHPREEHLLPLHVCYGAAGSAANQAFRFEILGKKASAYLW